MLEFCCGREFSMAAHVASLIRVTTALVSTISLFPFRGIVTWYGFS